MVLDINGEEDGGRDVFERLVVVKGIVDGYGFEKIAQVCYVT